jgi:hypothetical protein
MTGSYLQLTIEVIEGQYAGRKVFDRLNLKLTLIQRCRCRSRSAACPAFAAPCRGKRAPKDSSDLCDKPLMVKLAVKAADGQYSASNEIKGYEAAKGGAAMQAAATASAGTATPPWKR